MKKILDIEYMRKTLKIKSGVRAGGNGKGKGGPDPVLKYGIFPLYGLIVKDPD